MAKKIFLTIICMILSILALSTFCFAESNTTTKLGNEVSSSMNKTERKMDDLLDRDDLDNAGQTVKDGAKDMGNTIRDGMNDVGREIEDLGTDDDERTDNRAVAGTTGNYSAGEVQMADTNDNTGITRNAWIWIIMVVVALIIIAAVWYYATQSK